MLESGHSGRRGADLEVSIGQDPSLRMIVDRNSYCLGCTSLSNSLNVGGFYARVILTYGGSPSPTSFSTALDTSLSSKTFYGGEFGPQACCLCARWDFIAVFLHLWPSSHSRLWKCLIGKNLNRRQDSYILSVCHATVSDSEAVIHLAHVQHLWQSKLFVIFLVLARWRIRLRSELQRARQ